METYKNILAQAQEWLATIPQKPIANLPPAYEILSGSWSSDKGLLTQDLPPGYYTVDIETCELYRDYWVPICAVIYDWQTGTYYTWIARAAEPFLRLPIAAGSTLIGHYITGYDRQYFANEYTMSPPYEYIDTHGLALRLRGISNQQVPFYKLQAEAGCRSDWYAEHYGNSLKDLCAAYLGIDLDKDFRGDFSKWPWQKYMAAIKDIARYCQEDVFATNRLFRALWAECLEEFSPVSLHAMCLLSKSRMPLDQRQLQTYIDTVQTHCSAIEERVSRLLMDLLEVRYQQYKDTPFSELPASYQYLDWTIKKGLPAWYAKAKKEGLTLTKRLSPILLGCKYNGHLVYFVSRGNKGTWYAGDEPIPHPEGKPNLGQIFNKHCWETLGDTLTTDDPSSYDILAQVRTLQFWSAFRSRIKNALRFTHNGVHIPDYRPWGTISGRGADSLWLVSPSPKANVPGSELRSLINCGPDYRIIGADFASQELRIFALLGDSSVGRLGSSPLSQLLIDQKDLHRTLAENTGAPHRVCKNINYGAIYGLGLASAETYCRLAGMDNPRQQAQRILDGLKGKQLSNGSFYGGLASQSFNYLADLMSKPEKAESPILGNKITKALRTKDYAPSRQNWYVQTSGCDLRDLVVAYLNAVCPEVSLMLYVHDEPRYLVPQHLVPGFPDLLQDAHRFAIAQMAKAFGLRDLPLHFTVFNEIEIDYTWRKNCDDSAITPTQTQPLVSGIRLSYV